MKLVPLKFLFKFFPVIKMCTRFFPLLSPSNISFMPILQTKHVKKKNHYFRFIPNTVQVEVQIGPGQLSSPSVHPGLGTGWHDSVRSDMSSV